MNFDRVARVYRPLETIVFSGALQHARVRWLEVCRKSTSALIVGEGDGRFLCQLLRVNPAIEVDCVEASGGMIALTRRRLRAQSIAETAHVHFVRDNVLSWQPSKRYDLLVTHFVLDCLAEAELEQLVGKLAHVIAPGGAWLLADFKIPVRGWGKWYGRLLVPVMYAFFGCVAGLKTVRLVDPTPALRAEGFVLEREELTMAGILKSQLWRRAKTSG